MKRYFTKYLPVEGEVKEHSVVLAGGMLGAVVYINEEGYEIEVSNPTRVLPFLKKESVTLAKLFLCSRDRTIGQVSPKAKWVKEGDEFDASDLQLIIHDPMGFETEIDAGVVPDWALEKVSHVLFKCPCCGDFK